MVGSKACVLKIAKDSAVKARVQAVNQLRAIIVNADPQLREEIGTLGPAASSSNARS